MVILIPGYRRHAGLEYISAPVSTDILNPPDCLLHRLLLSVSVKLVDSLQGLLHLLALQGVQDGSLKTLSCQLVPLQQSGVAVSLCSQQVGFLVVHEWNPNQSLKLSFFMFAFWESLGYILSNSLYMSVGWKYKGLL